jgi:hypothetical protein
MSARTPLVAAVMCTIVGSGCTDRPQDSPLVASLTLSNGNTVEFWDEGNAAMVRESGKAYVAPQAHRLSAQPQFRGANHLVDLFKALSPDVVPPALVGLQERLTTKSDTSAASDTGVVRGQLTATPPSGNGMGDPSPSWGGTLPSAPSGKHPSAALATAATTNGCNNGCCDQTWMENTFQECWLWNSALYYWDWEKMAYNYGYSWMHITDARTFYGFLCSASGTSNWLVQGSGSTNYSVPEGHYNETYWIFGSPFSDQDYYLQGNNPTDMHLHTMCGAEFTDTF